ncbi:TetR/AcrR family transcriptional regulator [Niveispirillum cyanobacteriorum]|uniref:TetR family transcriptional regulator n=1 Tax=Niveispirillum cyanobacteriorum TaxID=1612173 RepID=A0A2K9NKY6_9PROT|nr:TetR/AcrR family transcriptional regulator [Niveispirillum cyanobacteriorum]AUN33738.1 TetR family transcriptional regulator [Niveispirillum cyanobacteriorum]GGE82357.1 TetR family transcriptional regulator [Niveispirillum cyanobacteriorum]
MNDLPRPRTRRKQARPAELLSAALDCFVEKGFAATRMDDIARRAGVAKGTFYLYFPSKEAVFEALVRETLLPRIAAVELSNTTAGLGAEAKLRAILSMLGQVLADPKLVAIPKLVLAEAGNFPDMARFYRREVIGRGQALLTSLFREGVERGEFRPLPDLEILARLFLGPIVLTALWQTTFAPVEDTPMPIDRLLSTHADLFLNSIKAPNGTGGAMGARTGGAS